MHTVATRRPARRDRLVTALLTIVALAATVGLTGCGDADAGGAGDRPLRIGYQRFGGLSLVKARNAAPEAQWSLFESGPALTEALKAGSIDLGQTGEAPPVFAAAAKIPFSIVGSSAPVPRGEAVLVRADSPYRSFADLKGRTVALNKGSNVHWLLVKLLAAHGMTLTDIEVRYLKPAEGRPAFDNGQVDAWIIWDPYFALAERPEVRVLADATGLASNREYLLAAPGVLKDRAEALRAFLATYREVTDWGIAHPDERARVLAPELKIPEETAHRALARSAQPLAPLTPAIGDELQAIADGFVALDLIPGPVDLRSRLDDRYAEVLG
ncbi:MULTISPECIES: aliphatic sulfonate ABC transporter substrate-binding protein [Micromonospora]|uniref:Putative aliphatic sulfonates-binding protein n=1 Tax=Micromonospora yangpuensis TaxID=683228 RepID=A0A1C6UQ44_9ACTN|nr:aliphatic sulfonate ABC transporter substrate-binding protein [Micromonospora yangpuensis]GGM08293.1 sulfonate ABC transporter substrate-binding protein [Micromonospora yangpuensis]SCL55949.1 sulfonate transport system substrate-binding protein [Micromonospora yangpuensis]